MQSKTADRVKLNAKKIAIETGLALLQAVEDGLFFMYGSYRYRRVAIGQGLEGLKRIEQEEELRRAKQHLRNYRKRKYIEERKVGNRRFLALTDSGRLMKVQFELQCAPKRRDGKYLIVAFDVPENHSAYRQTLRRFLRKCGFVRLQNSVWRTETDAEGPLTDWIKHLGAKDWVRIFLATEL